ncbi:GNAT family N-acetyltransferase [Terribacillus sp. DMT04]|uniref:GNAT family N-acetyltransferase n=1 Tax=Terribacillus sp. DMT04 TaxID=2850441 RepID=UPI001C2C14BC|nr:GNAT family protein [Terribacillus sp. DMT04]QXE00580.1 GNAT family N-acetyltransferase [Terribacillus sp. DMT04]
MLTFQKLETKRIVLDQVKMQDAPYLFATLSNENVTQFYGMDPLQSIEEAERVISSFRCGLQEGRVIRWGMYCKEAGRFLGTIGLHQVNRSNMRAEIGYELHPDHWKKGFANEAMQAVLRYCFEEIELLRIGAMVYPENTASASLLEKQGFQREGLLRSYYYHGGKTHDAHVYGLLREEWEAGSKS